ncbi:terpene synthase metal-binding domain-containing protein [Myxococcus stipitatus DSM 14675]|uniref:Terpene synthase n=1 Tax=Myxococcus stipitatus (strain DSM 14675 / JCM 12634 / Mx s8) TaxID=1278073 RepID=L7UFE5_MYXSD|nr:terpene synthase metal-binding domain-containing protein [Myxococcus stipitatus]AGC46585.1 terpene synthase metal-binding domain-containing protein [Myxococcus stipitatus DSM 14675]
MPRAVSFALPFESACSPDRDAARLRNLTWARRLGLVTNEVDEQRYLSWDIADLTARWLPHASGPELDLGIDAIVVGTLIDEQFDGARALPPDQVNECCDLLLDVFRSGEEYSPSCVLAAALSDVWERERRGASHEWARRAALHWQWFIEAFPQEARWRQGAAPMSRDSYLALRRESGLVSMMVDLIEKANGFETTERARQVPSVQRLLVLAVDIIDTMNDVCSADKELARGDVHNLVLVLQAEQKLTRAAAMTEAHDCMKRWCDEYVRVAARLPMDCARLGLSSVEADAVLRLVRGIEAAIGGHPDWYRGTRRYDTRIPLGEPAYAEDLMRPLVRPG